LLDPFVRCYGLVQRGGPGLACDDNGLALGPIALAKTVRDTTGQRQCRMRPCDDVVRALRLAYGPVADPVVERWCRGLAKVTELLARGEDAHARIYAVLLGFPKIAPEGMAKLAQAAGLAKYGTAWETEARVPAHNPGGGEWTSGGEIEVAAAGDQKCQTCPSGGSYGATGMFWMEGKIRCWDCAIKAAGAQDLPGDEKIRILEPYLLKRK